ncbi:PAS domain-containing protein [Massilia sp. UYP11]|uniref:PAS domain-containing protein n=1 Tax=Massilia sp. UYP11 TaxID=1756385 RepID=UPI003D1CD585
MIPGELTLFQAITEHIPNAAVFVVDQDFRYVHAGGSGLRAANMRPEDFEGKFLANVVPNDLLKQYLSDYTAIFSGETFIREHTVGLR